MRSLGLVRGVDELIAMNVEIVIDDYRHVFASTIYYDHNHYKTFGDDVHTAGLPGLRSSS